MSARRARNPVMILCAMIFAILPSPVTPSACARQFAGGSGTPDDPYQIATAEQLIAVGRDADLQTGHFVLTADIDLSGIPFTGAVIPRFSGTFDGGNRAIRNLTIAGGHRIGLFGEVMDWARISNLRVEDVNVVGTSTVGALVGHNRGVVHNCHATGTATGSGSGVGGVVGANEDGCITWCSSACTVIGGSCGGLLGWNYGRVVNCNSSGMVSGTEGVGGLVGNNGRDVVNCCSDAAVLGESKIGGLIGTGGGTLVNCYSRGKVVCLWQSSGGAGSPSYGPGSGVGGFIGYSVAVIAHCFWDVESSGQAVGVVWPRYHEDRKGDDPIGLSTAEMRDVRTYLEAGWDFAGETENGLSETWEMAAVDGYPILRAFHGSGRPFSVGRGTAEDPYLISEAAEFASICYEPWVCYRLSASIDLRGITWSMGVVPLFGGMLDGHGFVIRNLTIKGNRPAGLFGELARGGCVSNLGVEDVNVIGTNPVGALAGTSRGTVMSCYSTGIVRGNSYVGGLLGIGDAVNCYSTARVEGQEYVNGLTASGYATHCYSVGAITGDKIGLGHFVDANTFGPLPYASTWGRTTAEMMDANTFLAAGWDFVGETANGVAETWQMPDGGGYPVLSVFNGYVPPLAGGRGTREDPYRIATAQGLGAMSHRPGACYRLVESIDLSAARWSVPVAPCFYGSLDGNDRTIRGVSIQGENDLGFLGVLTGHASVENLSIEDVNVTGTGSAGGLVGRTWGGDIRNCSCTGVVCGGRWGTGGLIGNNSGAVLAGCAGDVAVSSVEGHVGGLVGDNYSGHILECHINAVVCGMNPRDITNNTGGLVGTNAGGRIRDCSTSGVVLGEGLVGGIAGWTSGDVIGCVSQANVTGGGEVGGLAGSAHGNPRIRSCCNRGPVTGESRTAGLVGRMDSGSLANCYSSGRVTSTDWYPLGGVVSETGGEIEVTGCFWDSQVSGVRGSLGGMGLTTREMMNATTYALNGWANDPNWTLDDGKDYPRLAWEQKPGQAIPEPVIDWLDGDGSEPTPYVITTREQLLLLSRASILWDRHFTLASDLDLAEVDIGRIGTGPGAGFTGNFDGGGRVIRNLTMKAGPSSAWHVGLFGYVDAGGRISRLGVENATVEGGYWSNYVGALIGYVRQGSVDRCHSTGSVSTGYRSFRTGGLIGQVDAGADITNCWSACDVHSGSNAGSIGGLVGANGGDIACCYATGRIGSDYGTVYLGGLVGANAGNLANSYATGSVGEWGNAVVGGLAGSNLGGGTIDKCFSTGVIAGSSAWGLVGDNYRATVRNSFWDIQTSGKTLSDGGAGLPTAEMQTAQPFLDAGWDFATVWAISEGEDYPRLRWEEKVSKRL